MCQLLRANRWRQRESVAQMCILLRACAHKTRRRREAKPMPTSRESKECSSAKRKEPTKFTMKSMYCLKLGLGLARRRRRRRCLLGGLLRGLLLPLVEVPVVLHGGAPIRSNRRIALAACNHAAMLRWGKGLRRASSFTACGASVAKPDDVSTLYACAARNTQVR